MSKVVIGGIYQKSASERIAKLVLELVRKVAVAHTVQIGHALPHEQIRLRTIEEPKCVIVRQSGLLRKEADHARVLPVQ